MEIRHAPGIILPEITPQYSRKHRMPPIIQAMRSVETLNSKDKIIQTARLAVVLVLLTALLSCRGACAPIPNKAAGVAPPNIGAAAAIIINRDSGATIWAKNPDKRLPPASTTKIATGFLLARDAAPDAIIPASPNAAQTPGHALGMRPGETFRAQDLLRAILLASANDASVAAAEYTAGREGQFTSRMNMWAQASGASNTHFANASGLPAPDHYSTARDLALLARTALQNPVFANVVRTRAYAVPRSNGQPPTLLTNENTLLWTVPGMEGVKAGWTREAGYCFVGAVTRNGLRLITVVLHSPDWRRDTLALLDYGFAQQGDKETRRQGDKEQGNRETHELTRKKEQEAGNRVGAQFIAPSPSLAPSPDAASSPDLAPSPNRVSSAVISPAPTSTPTTNAAPAEGSAPAKLAASAQNVPSDTSAPEVENPGLSGRQPDDSQTQNTTDHNITDNESRPQDAWRNATQTGTFSARQKPSPSSLTAPSTSINWRIWGFFIALLLVAGLLAGLKGNIAMPDFWLALFGKRRKLQSASGTDGGAIHASTPRAGKSSSASPEFSFIAPLLERRSARAWLEGVLDAPTRLLEPATRRQAAAILDTDPDACQTKALALLQSPNLRMRLAGAELIAGHAPRLAEDALLALLKEESLNAEMRGDAIQLLDAIGGDRHERLWLQMLLRDGLAPAAATLARLPRLEEATTLALKSVLTETAEGRAADGEMKKSLRNAHIACVLLAQGHFTQVECAPFLNAIPANHGEPILVSTLRGTSQPEALEALVEIVLNGHAYPALQALLEADPRSVRSILTAREPIQDRAKQTRVLIAKWLLWGEGNEEQIQKMATAGNDLARGALQLARMHRRDPALAHPDAVLAAVQIYSLRMGFSEHAAGDIALAFRKASTDGEKQSLALLPPELRPLAQVYAHPDVYESVQFAMHAEDGLGALLSTLAQCPANPQYRRELAFWTDKTQAEHRLLLTYALSGAKETSEEEIARTTMEPRANDPAPLVRNLALRWLHAHPNFNPTPEAGEHCLNHDASDCEADPTCPGQDLPTEPGDHHQ